jgi:hypothetical protein
MEFFEAFDGIDAAYVRYFPEVERPASSPNSINSSSSTCSNLRLPKLSLRTFDGNFSEWTSFIQFFDNAIHSRPELARIEKFQYLISSLAGEPLNLVKAMVIVHFNYFWNFAFFLARQPQDVLLHRFPPVKPCANENFPYPLIILRLGATLKHNKKKKEV